MPVTLESCESPSRHAITMFVIDGLEREDLLLPPSPHRDKIERAREIAKEIESERERERERKR